MVLTQLTRHFKISSLPGIIWINLLRNLASIFVSGRETPCESTLRTNTPRASIRRELKILPARCLRVPKTTKWRPTRPPKKRTTFVSPLDPLINSYAPTRRSAALSRRHNIHTDKNKRAAPRPLANILIFSWIHSHTPQVPC
jgi:hypothetical protein